MENSIDLLQEFLGDSPPWWGLFGGVVIAALNLVGALLVIFWRNPSRRFLNAGLGFAAGVMLTASFTSLIMPGVEYAGIGPVLLGLTLGAVVVYLGDWLIPHEHFVRGYEGSDTNRVRRIWLFIIAITLHNMPEGLAVGVSFGSGDFLEGVKLMTAIGIQNIPEGLAVAASLVSAGYGDRTYATLVGIRAGLVEIPLAVVGAILVHYMSILLPYAMGFAAGAMLYVISDEIIPETHRVGQERLATTGTILGIIVMLYLDVALG